VELGQFLQFLTEDPREIQAHGGPEQSLARRGVMHIWCNERQFTRKEVVDLQDAEDEDDATDGGVEGGARRKEAQQQAPTQVDAMALLAELGGASRARGIGEALLHETDAKRFAATLKNAIRVGKEELVAERMDEP